MRKILTGKYYEASDLTPSLTLKIIAAKTRSAGTARRVYKSCLSCTLLSALKSQIQVKQNPEKKNYRLQESNRGNFLGFALDLSFTATVSVKLEIRNNLSFSRL